MTVPAIVEERLGGEEVTARVALGGDDELFVTPARTLIYRSEGLLSGESVDEYSLDAERLTVAEGRRKNTITLDHGLDGETQFSVAADRFEEAIEPILHGVFTTAGVIEAGEEITDIYRLGELTIVITDARVVKHVGDALWDEEFEEFPYETVTGIDVEEGSVSSQIILEVDGRPQRIKIPSDDARRLRSYVEEGVLAYHGVSSYDEFLQSIDTEVGAEPPADDTEPSPSPEPAANEAAEVTATEPAEAASESLEGAESDASTGGGAESTEAAAESGGVSAGMIFGQDEGTLTVDEEEPEGDLREELASLRRAVERQNDLLRRHQQVIERLTRELKAER